MSTRGSIGFVVDGIEKIGYVHCNAYPGALGIDALTWLRREHHGHIRRKVAALRVVDSSTPPTDEDVDRLIGYADSTVGSPTGDHWYKLLRGTMGNPAAILDAGYIEDASDFPADSLYAECGVIVDLDANRLEVYQGFQEQPHDRGRFASMALHAYASGDRFYPCALIASWPLDALPTDDEFIAGCESREVAA